MDRATEAITRINRNPEDVSPETARLAACALEELQVQVLELIDERDEARRSVCEMSIQLGGVYRRVGGKIVEVTTPEGCAEIMRWDCFKEDTDGR